MEKSRQIKVLSITSLVVAIFVTAIGFAALSTTLNISSSAIVSANSDDFKIKIFGFQDFESIESFVNSGLSLENITLSENNAIATELEASSKSTIATINNTTYTITNVKASFEDKVGEVTYPLIIKNVGQYDAYLDVSKFNSNGLLTYKPTCSSTETANLELVNKACQQVSLEVSILGNDTGETITFDNEKYLIQKGTYIILAVKIKYTPASPDANVNVTFPDVKLTFTTTPTN